MKQLFFILIGCVLFFQSKAQTNGDEPTTNEVYISLTEKYSKMVDLTKRDQNVESFPFLKELSNEFHIESIKSSFHFSKSDELRRIIRVQLHYYDNAEYFIKALQPFKDDIKYAEVVPIFKLEHTPNDLGLNTASGQWSLHNINAQAAWDIATGATNVVVAIVDNAIEVTHRDLAPNMNAGYDVADNDADPSPNFSTFRHGTHVAGIAGAATNNGYGTIASIGYNTRIMPIKSTISNASYAGYITHGYEGITWAADNGAKVINCSWGGSSASITGQVIVDYAYNTRKAIVVAAAGNSGNNTLNYPAAYNNVVAVANSDINNCKASSSTYGSFVDVTAPGTSIRSTFVGNTYGVMSGTSMASPLVAGLCGLMYAVNPTQLDQATVINCLKSSATPIDYTKACNAGLSGQLGTGIIDAFAALQCVKSALCRPDVYITGTWGFPLTESSTWIKAVGRTTIPATASVKLDANPTNGFVEIVASSASDYFIANPTTGVFIAQALDGCDYQVPAKVSASTKVPPRLQEDEHETVVNTSGGSAPNNLVGVYPNPVVDKATFQLTIPENSTAALEIFDLTGKKRYQQEIGNTPQVEVDCSNYINGIYFYKILIDNKINKTGKFVVQK